MLFAMHDFSAETASDVDSNQGIIKYYLLFFNYFFYVKLDNVESSGSVFTSFKSMRLDYLIPNNLPNLQCDTLIGSPTCA